MKADGFPSLAPDEWTVLGHRLRPLSLGHAILLQALDSPFATWLKDPPKTVTVYDVLLAVEVCRRPWPAARRWLTSRAWPWHMKWRHIRWALWWRNDTIEQIVLREKAGQLYEYSAYWNQGPECNTTSDGRMAGAPHLRRLFTFLVSHMHMSESQALGTTVADAVWHFCVYWEMNGTLQIGNDVDRALVKAAEAAAMAEALKHRN